MTNPTSIEARLYEHVLGQGQPHAALLNTGILSDEWTDQYLLLVREMSEKYAGNDYIHRSGVAAVHFASFYLKIRYDAWNADGRRNKQTEANLARLRFPSELILLAPVVEKSKAEAIVF